MEEVGKRRERMEGVESDVAALRLAVAAGGEARGGEGEARAPPRRDGEEDEARIVEVDGTEV